MRIAIQIASLIIAACSAGSGEGLDEFGRPVVNGAGADSLANLENIQKRIFTPMCTHCHVGAAAPQGLRLDEVNAYGDLVNVPSRQVGSLLRVEPFNPDDSYLVQKIEGTASVGGQMPLGGPPVAEDDIQLIRQWILEGAMNTPASAFGAGQVSSLISREQFIQLNFDRELDATTVHIGSILLTDLTGNRIEGYSVSVVPFNNRAIRVHLPGRPGDTDYRLELNTSNVASILDLSGNKVMPFGLEFR